MDRKVINYVSVESEDSEALPTRRAIQLYPGRYYVLMVLSFLAIHQNITWMTFATVPDESYQVFHLSNEQITILAGYGPVFFILLTFPFMWLMERVGLRVIMVTSCWLLAVGGGIRCFVPSGQSLWVILFHVGHMLIGIVGLPVMMAAPRLSSLWFPVKQRTFATAIGTMAQLCGVAIAFIIVPYLTRKYDIHTMLYVQAEIGIFIALLASIYFPSRPPTPPSVSAGIQRTNFKLSLKSLLLNPAFIVLGISGGLVNGANMGFSSVLSIILNPSSNFTDSVQVSSVSEFFHSNAWLGAFSALMGMLGGQIVGLLADRIQRKFKLFLIVLLTLATLLAFWFAISVYNYTTNNAVNIFISLCLQYFFSFATTPLYFEAAIEVTYPVPEGTSAGFLTILSNISTLLLQIIALCHVFSNDHPERARIMVWVLGGLTALSGLEVSDNTKNISFDEPNQRESQITSALRVFFEWIFTCTAAQVNRAQKL